jgi:hypothetical protein
MRVEGGDVAEARVEDVDALGYYAGRSCTERVVIFSSSVLI